MLLPCDNTIVSGFRWGRTKDGKRYSSQRSGEYFVLTLCRLMNWNPDYRYKILGRMVEANGKPVVAFDLNSYECFPMSPPTKELMKLTLEQRIAHGGHPVLRWMMDNIFIRTDPAGNIKADKEKSTEKIDGAIATIMALDRAVRCGNVNTESVYNKRGILFI